MLTGGMPGGMNGRAGPRQDPPIEHQLPCTLEELYQGTTKRMKISRNVTDATGRMDRVTETLSIDIKPGWKKGTKITFPKKGAASRGLCRHMCRGVTAICLEHSSVVHYAECERSFLSGRFPVFTGVFCDGAGDERPGTIPADIVFVINEKKHPVFEREGNDLIHTAKLPLVDSLCGATIKLTTLDGRPLTVCIKPAS